MATPDLQFQAETARSQIAATLDELRSRMTAGQIVDQALSYARSSGGTEFVYALGNEVKRNPIPLVLVAAGLGWLMMGQRRPELGANAPSIVPDAGGLFDERFSDKALERSDEVAEALGDATQGAAGRAQNTFAAARHGAEQAASTAFDTMVGARDRARNAAAATGESLSSAYSTASGAVRRASSAVSDTAAVLGRGSSHARRAGQSLAEQVQNIVLYLLREQPLTVGAIGVAIGAVIGASLPRSRQEDELMGEASESFKETVKQTAREQAAHAQEASGRIVEKVRSSAEEQGLNPQSGQSLVRDIGAKVSEVAAAAKQATEDELNAAKEKVESAATAPEGADFSHGEGDRSQSIGHSKDPPVY